MGDDLADSTVPCSMFYLIFFLVKYKFCTMTFLDFSQFGSRTTGKGTCNISLIIPLTYIRVVIGYFCPQV